MIPVNLSTSNQQNLSRQSSADDSLISLCQRDEKTNCIAIGLVISSNEQKTESSGSLLPQQTAVPASQDPVAEDPFAKALIDGTKEYKRGSLDYHLEVLRTRDDGRYDDAQTYESDSVAAKHTAKQNREAVRANFTKKEKYCYAGFAASFIGIVATALTLIILNGEGKM